MRGLRLALAAALLTPAAADANPPKGAELTPLPLPGPRHGHRIEKIEDGLLCFGGFGDGAAANRETEQTWWLAPGAKEWRRRADMRSGRAFFGSAVVAGKVFAIGDGIERYDPKSDRWTVVVPAGRLPKTHFGAAAVGPTVFVLGGFGGDTDKLWAVDLPQGDVRSLPPPPGYKRGDHFHCLHPLDGELHVVGGIGGENFEPKTDQWILTDPKAPADAPPARCWKAGAPPPTGVWAKFAAQGLRDGKLYLFGDFGAFRFDPATKKWTPRKAPPFDVVMPQAVAHEEAIWVIGGVRVDQEQPRTRVLLRYDPAGDSWTDHSR